MQMERPNRNEYAQGYQMYVDLVESGDFIELLDENTNSTISLFKSIGRDMENFKYAVDKWTIKEVLMHIIDTERGLSYRAIVCCRKDGKTPLYEMDEAFYASNVDVTDMSMDQLIEEFIAVRRAFKCIYTNNKEENFKYLGNGIGHRISARAIGYIAIGHASHHCTLVRHRYLV